MHLLAFLSLVVSKLANLKQNYSVVVSLRLLNSLFIVKVQCKAVHGLTLRVPGG